MSFLSHWPAANVAGKRQGKTPLQFTSDIGFVASGEARVSGAATSGVLTVIGRTLEAKIHLIGDYLKDHLHPPQRRLGRDDPHG